MNQPNQEKWDRLGFAEEELRVSIEHLKDSLTEAKMLYERVVDYLEKQTAQGPRIISEIDELLREFDNFMTGHFELQQAAARHVVKKAMTFFGETGERYAPLLQQGKISQASHERIQGLLSDVLGSLKELREIALAAGNENDWSSPSS